MAQLTIIIATVSCGVFNAYLATAPRCSLCQIAHQGLDNINKAWCDGDCFYDHRENKCKQIGKKNLILGGTIYKYFDRLLQKKLRLFYIV